MKQTTDITDSIRDNKRIPNKEKESVIDLPELKDVPGQEHVHVLPLGEIADTTISSDDEEGKGVLDVLNKEKNEDETANSSTDTPDEVGSLDDTNFSSANISDEAKLRNVILDKTDKDGDLLNEEDPGDEFSGSDLDIPGTEDDDEDEAIGEEDEENNIYSPAQK